MNILPVVYVSQLMSGAIEHHNDCGSASSLMLLRTYKLATWVTVDQFYNSIVPQGDVALSAGSMQTKMASYGLKNEWKVGTTMEQIFGFLRNRRPVLALIHYAPLVNAGLTEKKTFLGAHFIVITGIDLDSAFINDPYRTDGKTNIAIPLGIFEKAWSDCIIDGNPTGGCIVPKLAIQDLSVTPPVYSDEYLYAIVNGTQINGINVRSGAGSNYELVETLWRSTTPIIRATTISTSGDWIQLTNKSGWVYLPYLKKK